MGRIINIKISSLIFVLILIALGGCTEMQSPSSHADEAYEMQSVNEMEAYENNTAENDQAINRLQLIKESSQFPEWYRDDLIEYIEDLVDELLADGYAPDTYLSLADITDDGIPEIFIGYAALNDGRVDYWVYSYSEKQQIIPSLLTFNGQNIELYDSGNRMSATVSEDIRYPLFRSTCYLDSSGQKYYLAYRHSGKPTYDRCTINRLDYVNGELSSSFQEMALEDFAIIGKWIYLPATTTVIDKANPSKSILAGLCNYLDIVTGT